MTWSQRVEGVLAGPGQRDPHVSLLEDELAAGAKVRGLNLLPNGAYRVLLERNRELRAASVPHTPAFTQWCVAHGLAMATLEEEEARVARLFADGMEQVDAVVGRDFADAVLHAVLTDWGPPRSRRVLEETSAGVAVGSRDTPGTVAAVERLLADAVRALAAFGYDREMTANVLDGGLVRFLEERHHLELARSFTSRRPVPGAG